MYYTILICIALLIISFLFFSFLVKKKAKTKYIVTSYTVILVVEMLLFAFWPIPNYYFENIKITALNNSNDISNGHDVIIKSFYMQNTLIDFPDVESGFWFWQDGVYKWLPEYGATNSVELKIPVGIDRKIVFQGGNGSGLVNISYKDSSKDIDLYSEKVNDISINISDSSDGLILKNEIVRILVFMFIHLIVFYVTWRLTKAYYEKIVKLADRYKYELIFFIASLFMIIRYGCYPNPFTYSATFYLKGYEFGFVKRGLIGALYTNLSPYVSQEQFVRFILCFSIFFYLWLSFILGKFIKQQKDEKIRWFFVLFILALPGTFAFVTYDLRLDIYLVLLFILMSLFIAKDYCLFVIPILAVNMLLINETSCTFFLMPVFAMLLYKFVKNGDKKYLTTLLGSLFFSIIVCAKFLFGKDPWSVYDVNEIIQHMQNHANFSLYNVAMSAEIWNFEQLFGATSRFVSLNYRTIIFFFMSLIPSVILFIQIWSALYKKKYNKYREAEWQYKFALFFLILSPLFAFVAMMIAYDFGRYTSFMLYAAIVTLFFFIHEEDMQLNYDKLFCSNKNNGVNIVPCAICIFYLVFGLFGATATATQTAARFARFFSALLGM